MSCKSCERVIKKISHIVEGSFNLIINNPEIEELACKRKVICTSCIYRQNLIKVNGIQYYYCTKCTCPVESKIRSKNETCPINKW